MRKTAAERQAAYRKANPEKARAASIAGQLRLRYGLTLEQRDAMLAAQDGLCANPLCATPIQFQRPKGKGSKRKSAAVDHCHDTQRVRGVLCFVCNEHLGLFEKMLQWAPEYLKRSQ